MNHTPMRDDEGQSKFNKCMPIFQYVLIVFLFAVSPVLISIGYIYILSSPMETKDLYSYFTLVFVLSILLTVQFFGHFLGDFERLKAENLTVRKSFTKRAEHMKSQQIPSHAMNSRLKLRQDIYSLLTVSLVKPQYKRYCDLVAKTGQVLPSDFDQKLEIM